MHLRATSALALSQGLASYAAAPKSATGRRARLTLPAICCRSPRFGFRHSWVLLGEQRPRSFRRKSAHQFVGAIQACFTSYVIDVRTSLT